MPRKRTSRVYYRNGRAWGDFRDYADMGGKLEPLIAPGEKYATTDPDVANKLAADKVTDYERRRRNKHLLGVERQADLQEYAAHHLREKARAGKVDDFWMGRTEERLWEAVTFFGAGRELSTITVRDVQRWAAELAKKPGKRTGTTLSPGTVRHYLNALSNLYQRAQSEGYVVPGYNPAAAMMEKPTARKEEAHWLEVHEGALLLESARLYQARGDERALPYSHPLVATFLLAGGRESEVLGLEVDDISFDRKTVTFRPNEWRRLKTRTSHRSVPLHPQLEEILREYVFGGKGPLGALLFPSMKAEKEAMITDFRKTLDGIAERAGWQAGEIRTKALRHTYCAARLQCLDRGHPIAPWTVAKEMGHGGRDLVDRVYGHLGQVRHRSEHVEYRIEQHRAALGDRLAALAARGNAGEGD